MSHGFPLRRSDSPSVPGAGACGVAPAPARRWLTSPFPVIQAARGAPISSRALRLRACRHGIAVCIALTPGAVALGRRPSRTSCHPARGSTSPRAVAERKRASHARRQAPAPFAGKKSVLRTKLSELRLREAYGGRRAHCRPPSLCAGPARQLGGAKALPGSGAWRASETQGRRREAGTKSARSTANLPRATSICCRYGAPIEEGQQAPEQAQWGWRTPGNGEIHGYDGGDGTDAGITAGEDPAIGGAVARRHHPFRIRRCRIGALQRLAHVLGYGPRDEQDVGMARGGNANEPISCAASCAPSWRVLGMPRDAAAPSPRAP